MSTWFLAIWIYGGTGWRVVHIDYPDGVSCHRAVEIYRREGADPTCWERLGSAAPIRSPENSQQSELTIPMVIKGERGR